MTTSGFILIVKYFIGIILFFGFTNWIGQILKLDRFFEKDENEDENQNHNNKK